jgi:cytochrome c
MRTANWSAGLAACAAALAAAVALAQPPGDPAKGADVYDDHCSECHVTQGVGQGPSLVGVVGRRAGAVPGFAYTAALKSSGVTWTPAELNLWLQGPGKLVPGTAMLETVSNPAQRRDLIAYLATLKR